LDVDSNGRVYFNLPTETQAQLSQHIISAKRARTSQKLLTIQFDTVDSYFFLLFAAAKALAPLNQRAVLYFAAAVSDFFVPQAQMATHKIQSSEGPPDLPLANCPKLLGLLREIVCPSAYFVSFKLETDENILLTKARKAITNYNMHLVVANELKTRNERVILVTALDTETITKVGETEVEGPLIQAVARAHAQFQTQNR